MGVKGLWDLISPSGRRVNIDILEGRVIAVDVSIWLFQFLKAMRDPEGNVARGAHLVGFFKRLCKLLYYKVRPVMVFDGPPPELKRRVLRERRRLRDEEQNTLKKTAEKLIINFVKRKALEAKKKRRRGEDEDMAMSTPTPGGGIEDGSRLVTLRDVLYGTARQHELEADGDLRDFIEVESDQEFDRAEAVEFEREQRARRYAYYESIPEEFRGFLAERRRLDEVTVPRGDPNLLAMPGAMSMRERMAMFGITIHDIDENLKVKRTVFSEEEEFKEYRAQNEFGEETVIRLPLSAEIDETVFMALPTKVQYRVLCELRDQWLSDLRLRAIAARDDPHVFSNVQIESYIRTIRSNQEIEKVKQRMGEEVRRAHFGPLDGDTVGGLGDVGEGDGGFLEFYPRASIPGEIETNVTGYGERMADEEEGLSLEEKVRRALEEEQRKKREEEEAERKRGTAGEAGDVSKTLEQAMRELQKSEEEVFGLQAPGEGGAQRGGRKRGRHLRLFQQWEELEAGKREGGKFLLHEKASMRDLFKPRQESPPLSDEDRGRETGHYGPGGVDSVREFVEFDTEAMLHELLGGDGGEEGEVDGAVVTDAPASTKRRSRPPLAKDVPESDSLLQARDVFTSQGRAAFSESAPPERPGALANGREIRHKLKLKRKPEAAKSGQFLLKTPEKVLKGNRVIRLFKGDTEGTKETNAQLLSRAEAATEATVAATSRAVLPELLAPQYPAVDEDWGQWEEVRSAPIPLAETAPTGIETATREKPATDSSVVLPMPVGPQTRQAHEVDIVEIIPIEEKDENVSTSVSQFPSTADFSEWMPKVFAQPGLAPAPSPPRRTIVEASAQPPPVEKLASAIPPAAVSSRAPLATAGEARAPVQSAPTIGDAVPRGVQASIIRENKSAVGVQFEEKASAAVPVPSTESPSGIAHRRDDENVLSESETEERPPTVRMSTEPATEWLNLPGNEFERRLYLGAIGGQDDPVGRLLREPRERGEDRDLDQMAETLEEEAQVLLSTLRRGKQRADDVSQEMRADVRELLEAFGIPYVEAPGEAEAQAAWLVQVGLAEAVMSDDSDAMVFGCAECFRNFFADAKGIEFYTLKDVQRSLGLTLDDLRVMSLLLGCDYTLGVKGIGIVNALEVMTAYQTIDDLRDFGRWARDIAHITDPGIKPLDPVLVKEYKLKHYNYRGQWEFPSGPFPPLDAYEAFQTPRVDVSREPFEWVEPNRESVIRLLHEKAGFTREQVARLLDPVLEKIRTTAIMRRQTLMDTFVHRPGEDAIAVYRSERLKRAMNILTQRAEASSAATLAAAAASAAPSRRRRLQQQTRLMEEGQTGRGTRRRPSGRSRGTSRRIQRGLGEESHA